MYVCYVFMYVYKRQMRGNQGETSPGYRETFTESRHQLPPSRGDFTKQTA